MIDEIIIDELRPLIRILILYYLFRAGTAATYLLERIVELTGSLIAALKGDGS